MDEAHSGAEVKDARFLARRVSGVHSAKMNVKTNGDIYMVGSKTIPVKSAGRFVAFVLSGVARDGSSLWHKRGVAHIKVLLFYKSLGGGWK